MQRVTTIVAEMTGYPADLLDPDLDLEADLGVDTVKQAEVFAAVRGHYAARTRPEPEAARFPDAAPCRRLGAPARATGPRRTRVGTGEALARPKGPRAAAAAALQPPAVVHGDLRAIDARAAPLADAVTAPAPHRLPAHRRAARRRPGGGDGGRRRRGQGADETAHQGGGQGAGAASRHGRRRPAGSRSRLAAGQARSPASTGCRRSTPRATSPRLDAAAWHEALRRRVKSLYATMRQLYDGSPFLVAATRLGGFHGYDAAGATNPLGGAVVGFAKSYRKERPDAMVKAVDVAVGAKPAVVADQLDRRDAARPGLRRDRPPAARDRFGVAFVEAPFPALGDDGQPVPGAGMVLGRDSRCSWSPARPAASCRRSPPTWLRPRAAPSTCSTSRPRPTATTPTWRPSARTATASRPRSPRA